MSERFHVRLHKESFVFSAAHFITYHGSICEPLHGHNYRVACEVFGPLDENRYVIDFIALRDTLLEITKQLDHHVLLPTQHAQIHVEVTGEEVAANYHDRRWIFPRSDCILLPLVNTTAELLAQYIGESLLDRLQERFNYRPQRLVLEVDECEGQIGVWELQL